jgi:PucR family transcriptional regulator, purine catabolism regulatory protein
LEFLFKEKGDALVSVKVRELLEDRYFSKYKVLAGHSGLDREIQAVALFDAPDGYKWYSGKEFILTTGYLFKDNIELFKDIINHLHNNNAAALGIKVERYLKQIPYEILLLCDNLNLPLISIPYEPAWVEVIDAVNAFAMNSYMMRMNGKQKKTSSGAASFYPEMKIMETIENLSRELNLSVSIIDFLQDENFHYPSKEKNEELEKTLKDLLEPSFDFQKEKLDHKINIYRIKNLEDIHKQSWIMIPIQVNDMLVGYIVVWERGKGLGYYDLLVLRLTMEILLYIYGQIYYMNSKEANFQDDFMREILFEKSEKEKLLRKAKNLYWDIQKNYVCISFKQMNDQINLEDYPDLVNSTTRRIFPKKGIPLGLIYGNIILFHPVDGKSNPNHDKELKKKCGKLIESLEMEIPNANIIGGIGYSIDAFYNMKKSYMESMKTIEIGQHLYPESKVLFYKDLGPFGFIRLESFKEDFHHNIENILPVLQQDDHEELISTLKAFLDNKCNYNMTAKQLFLHNNTVRYRISKIQQLCNIDLDDSTERLKLEILLKFVKHLDI